MFKIESGIPLPPVKAGAAKYPFDDLQPGESFFVPFAGNEPWGRFENRIRSSVSAYTHRNNDKKLVSRQVEGRAGIRIWRVE